MGHKAISLIGYDENFLGQGDRVALPELIGPAKEQALAYNEAGDIVRHYTHFSLVMNRKKNWPHTPPAISMDRQFRRTSKGQSGELMTPSERHIRSTVAYMTAQTWIRVTW